MQACPDCRRINSPDARFCDQCGRQLAPSQSGYTPRHLADRILRTRASLEGERKQVTVFFLDIKGSVRMSQQVDPETWHQIMDRFFEILTEAVHAHEGTINQYTGDGIMGLFGAPLAHEDHARRACHAALRCQKELLALAGELRARHGLNFAFRAGLNAGEVVVGRIGDDLRMDYTAQGPTVGLAARMEQLARPNTIYLTAPLAELVDGYFELVGRGQTSVPGYDGKVGVFELRGAGETRHRFELNRSRGLVGLVGRDAELSMLEAYLGEALAGHGRVVGISADTGIGKSRLVYEFARRAQAQGVTVQQAQGLSHHRADPAFAFREFFFGYFGLKTDDDPDLARRKLQAAVQRYRGVPPSLLQSLMSILGFAQDGKRSDTGREMQQLMMLAEQLIRAGALAEPGVVVLENMQWLDVPQTATFLDRLVDAVADSPVMLLYTARSDYAHRWRGRPGVRSMMLRPLGSEQLGALLDEMLGEDDALASLKLLIAERCGGNPLFAEEIVRSLVATGVIEEQGDGYRLRGPVDAIEIPPSVQSVIAARIDGLPAERKRLLEVAAVVGRDVPRRVLARVSGLPDDSLARELEALAEDEFLLRRRGDDSAPVYSFRQSLLQDVAYRTVLLARRRELHLAVAQAYAEVLPTTDPHRERLVAEHYILGEDCAGATRWTLQAADRAVHYDLAQALTVLEAVDELLLARASSDGTLALRLQVLARWLLVAARAGVPQKRIDEVVAQGEEILEQGVDTALAAYFRAACGTERLLAGELDAGVALYRDAVETADPTGEPGIRAAARVGLVYALLLAGELSAGLEQADECLALCGDKDDLGSGFLGYSPRLAAQCFKAWLCAEQGRLDEAGELLDQALQRARARAETEVVAAALTLQAVIACERGRCGDGVTAAGEAVRISDAVGNRALKVNAQIALGRARALSGEWAAAVTLLEDAAASADDLRTGLNEGVRLQIGLAQAYVSGGDSRLARNHAAEAVKLAERQGARVAHIEALLVQIDAGLIARRPRPYLRRYQAALAQAEELIEITGARLLAPQAKLRALQLVALRDEDVDLEAPLAELAAEFAALGAACPAGWQQLNELCGGDAAAQ